MKSAVSKAIGVDVIVVGAGLAGLACAKTLAQQGLSVTVMEAAGRIGGRLKTDRVDGFLLDHGFQVLQTAYPEARKTLNYKTLRLKAFDPGAVIRLNKRFYRVADPVRCPRYGIDTLFSPVGTLGDKLRLVRLVNRIRRMDDNALFRRPELATSDYLRQEGFTQSMIASFLRPFFSGVCLDPEMSASSRVFQYVFKMLATGDAALPAQGIAAIPAQLAAEIPQGSIRTQRPVVDLGTGWVRLDGGQRVPCGAVVVAADGREGHRLLGTGSALPSYGVHCLYFAAPEPPLADKLLVINGEGAGPINNLTVVSNVAPSYAPLGQSLITVTVLDTSADDQEALETDVRKHLETWYGQQAGAWRFLKRFWIRHGLPSQSPPTPNPLGVDPRVRDGIYVCGEYG
ncbi:MAG: NAD(P)/FAD-dependent oxidoreductase, partial [Thermodesulfobacteriota bacterium]|nr:NAD(P)/FAD-dependent oxidoreductase [Thermodesulfobacteriota bacterium]